LAVLVAVAALLLGAVPVAAQQQRRHGDEDGQRAASVHDILRVLKRGRFARVETPQHRPLAALSQ
jgi:hypothetical protein